MIKNLGGVFGRNPTFNNVDVEGDLTVEGSIIGAVAAGGSNTQVQFNNAGVLDANAGLTYDSATETLRFRSHPTRYLTIGPDGVGASAISAYGNRALALNSSDYNVEISATNGSVSIDSPEVTITSNMGVGGVITGTNTTASTSSTTGAVIIAGGAGIAKDSYINTVRVGLGAAGTNNTTLGASTGSQLTAGSAGCTMVGYQAGFWNSSGNGNTSVGQNCLLNTRTGSWNSALGINAIFTNQSGSHNVSVGLEGLYSVTGSFNTGIGSNSGYHLAGASTNNICIGYNAGKFQADGATALTASSNSCYLGTGSRGLNNSDSNSIVIGSSAIGIGANTTVIGTSSTTANRIFGVQATGEVAPTIASASTIAPTKQISFVSGTTAIVTITAPTGIATTGGQITLIPTGIFTTTTAGNIALASTAVVSRALIMTYDSTTAKWYPSY